MSLPALPSTTDIRSITERVNAIIKNVYNKVIPVGTDNYVLTSDGTTLAWEALPTIPIANSGATTFLGADVALNNTANFFSGPNTGSIGASGQVWLIVGVAQAVDTAGGAGIEVAIFDGSAYVANSVVSVPSANIRAVTTVCAVVTLSGATTFTLRAKDNSSTSGVLQTSGPATGIANKATSITAVRLA